MDIFFAVKLITVASTLIFGTIIHLIYKHKYYKNSYTGLTFTETLAILVGTIPGLIGFGLIGFPVPLIVGFPISLFLILFLGVPTWIPTFTFPGPSSFQITIVWIVPALILLMLLCFLQKKSNIKAGLSPEHSIGCLNLTYLKIGVKIGVWVIPILLSLIALGFLLRFMVMDEFYGRVIDQYGQPVVNKPVSYFRHYYMDEDTVNTDSDGNFKINTPGSKLSLFGIEGEGFLPYSSKNPDFTLISVNDPNGEFPNWHDYNSTENPYILRVWRQRKYTGETWEKIFCSDDKRYYTASLISIYNRRHGTHPKRIEEGKITGGHIYLSCSIHKKNDEKYGNWTLHITPVDGGIQETNDTYTTLAPESGYQSSLNIQRKARESINKKYYFKSNNAKEYGSLNLHVYDTDVVSGSCSIKIKYSINLTGSRNLDLKDNN
jgi:hypothetical protein